jgi:glucose/arabinose dehydrogenase
MDEALSDPLDTGDANPGDSNPRASRRWLVVGSIAVVILSALWLSHSMLRLGIDAFGPQQLHPKTVPNGPSFIGADGHRSRIDVSLREIAGDFSQPTDARFVPGRPQILVVLEKHGVARWVSLADGTHGRWLELEVLTNSEQGLLGIAFHPEFRRNGSFFLNATVKDDAGNGVSEISAWRAKDAESFPEGGVERDRVLLRVGQPYQNHNAGQLEFGPDGYLYVGFGDGGYRDDPQGHGQNTTTFLGAMLRIDVDTRAEGKPYGIPPDNPFREIEGFRAEIWAYGLRNPWRYTFDPQGRLIVADVGQDQWEEVDIVHAGDNLGWNVFEGRHCFRDNSRCEDQAFVQPVYEYGRDDGSSITGGVVYTGSEIPELRNHYVFGDFVSGRLWAMTLPKTRSDPGPVELRALGRWMWQPVAMTRDAEGNVYVVDYRGSVYRLDQD